MNHTHKHEVTPNHSPAQVRMFFALVADLHFNAEEVKRRAKLHFGVAYFNLLNVTQMNWLIEKLLEKVEEQKRQYAR
jgi:hypothetical protein